MRTPLAIALCSALLTLSLAASGCNKSEKTPGPPPKDPCGKSVDRMIRCVGQDNPELSQKMASRRKDMIQQCNTNELSNTKAIRCVRYTGCKKFLSCLAE